MFFGKIECIANHGVCLLLCGGFKHRHIGKTSIVARVLFVLRRVHRRVIGCYYYQAAVYACCTHIHKHIGSNIHTHMFHTNHGSATGIGHTQCGFHGSFFVCRPFAVNVSLCCNGRCLYVFCNFCRWSSRIGIYARQTGIYGSLRYGFVAKQY